MSHEIVAKKVYYFIFALLIALTLLTVEVARVDLGHLNIVVALVIAGCKAFLVILYFMHVRAATPLTKLFVGAGFFWLAILIGLTLSDFLTRNPIPGPGQ